MNTIWLIDCNVPANVAVTDCAPPWETVQVVSVPEQAPPQPANCDPSLLFAVKVTTVPVKFALHALPQSMPPGELVTLPPCTPASVTLRLMGELGGGGGPPEPFTTPWHPARRVIKPPTTPRSVSLVNIGNEKFPFSGVLR